MWCGIVFRLSCCQSIISPFSPESVQPYGFEYARGKSYRFSVSPRSFTKFPSEIKLGRFHVLITQLPNPCSNMKLWSVGVLFRDGRFYVCSNSVKIVNIWSSNDNPIYWVRAPLRLQFWCALAFCFLLPNYRLYKLYAITVSDN